MISDIRVGTWSRFVLSWVYTTRRVPSVSTCFCYTKIATLLHAVCCIIRWEVVKPVVVS